MRNTNKSFNQENFYSEKELDLNSILNILIRGRYLIILTTSVITLLAIIYTYIVKPVYKGSFQIVVKSDQNLNSNSSILSGISKLSDFAPGILTNKTQEVILKSTSVLKPVYEYNLEYHRKKYNKNYYISYRKWLENSIEIGFEKDTNVLTVNYKNKDKKFIINTLERISSKYQDYSKLEKEKNMTNTINYLTKQQKLLKIKSDESFKELNIFTINNGLGNLDGFVSLGKYTPSYDFGSVRIKKKNLNNNDFDQGSMPKLNTTSKERFTKGGRFENQFSLLSIYETEYSDLSSKLKPNSQILKNLESKILVLRESLKRPNQILTKYRELLNYASRDEYFLNSTEELLALNKFEKAKQNNPWELISLPTIDEARVFPKRRNIASISFFLSFAFSSLLAIFLERKSELVFEEEEIKSKLKINFIEKIYLNSKLNTDLIYKFFKNNNDQLNISSNKNNNFLVYINQKQNKLNFILEENEFSTEYLYDLSVKYMSNKNIIFLVEPGKINKSDIIYLNQLSNICSERILGWLFISN